jgi:hypothetical protein
LDILLRTALQESSSPVVVVVVVKPAVVDMSFSRGLGQLKLRQPNSHESSAEFMDWHTGNVKLIPSIKLPFPFFYKVSTRILILDDEKARAPKPSEHKTSVAQKVHIRVATKLATAALPPP